MKRREFITIAGGAVAGWPLVARAQQGERLRSIGVLMSIAAQTPEPRIAAFLHGLQLLGWTEGRNVRIDIRWGAGDADRIRKFASELVALGPDVILAPGSATLGPLLQATRDVPIVFVHVPDPVGAGYVDSLARPGGNATGFTHYEYSISGKWLELLKQTAPSVRQAGVMRDANISAGLGLFAAIHSLAPAFGIEVIPVNVRDAGEIERSLATFARSPNGGLIVTSSPLAVVHRKLIITLAARHKLPTVYYERSFVTDGRPHFLRAKFGRAVSPRDRLC